MYSMPDVLETLSKGVTNGSIAPDAMHHALVRMDVTVQAWQAQVTGMPESDIASAALEALGLMGEALVSLNAWLENPSQGGAETALSLAAEAQEWLIRIHRHTRETLDATLDEAA